MKNIFIVFLALSISYAGSTTKIFSVEGMMCGVGCVNTINKAVESIAGIDNVKVDFSTKTMEVTFDDVDQMFEAGSTAVQEIVKDQIQDKINENIMNSLPNPYKATFVKEILTKEYAVGGMTCMGCVSSIRNAIDGLDGLENYDVNIEKETLYIEFDISKIDDKAIISQIPEKFKIIEIVKKDDDLENENNVEN